MSFLGEGQSAQEVFRTILMTVVGQAYRAAGYELEERPLQWAGGLFRFSKSFEDGLYGFIAYQLLAYVDTEWAARNPSRFKVTLIRSDRDNATLPSDSPHYVKRDLSALVVEDFGVPIVPSAAYWWTFNDMDELGKGLAEAGHLVVGYGMPYLSRELTPPNVG